MWIDFYYFISIQSDPHVQPGVTPEYMFGVYHKDYQVCFKSHATNNYKLKHICETTHMNSCLLSINKTILY